MSILISMTSLSMRKEQNILCLKIMVWLMTLLLLDGGLCIWSRYFNLLYIISNNGSLKINFVNLSLCQNFSFLNGLENEIWWDWRTLFSWTTSPNILVHLGTTQTKAGDSLIRRFNASDSYQLVDRPLKAHQNPH